MGMAPSADLSDDCGLFQPAHGTAPSIAGQDIANPVGTILSVAMMLEWLGHPETIRGARMIESAVATALAEPANATADIGGKIGTRESAARIIAALDDEGPVVPAGSAPKTSRLP